MPLMSKGNLRELRAGDAVKMQWLIARIFPDVDIAVVSTTSVLLGGTDAASPQTVTLRVGTGKGALTMVPSGDPVAEGKVCLLLWRVIQVYPSTGTVLLRRDGLGGTPEEPAAVTMLVGALAADLEYVARPPATQMQAPAPFDVGLEPVAGRFVEAFPFTFEPAFEAGEEPESVVPIVTSLTPSSTPLGAPSFTLHVRGYGFDASTVIVFAGYDEPTTVVSDTEVTTGVDMSVWLGPDTVQVGVHNPAGASNLVPFTFLAAASRRGEPTKHGRHG